MFAQASITRAGEALKAKRYFAGIEELGRAWVLLESLHCVNENKESSTKGLAKFEAEWEKSATTLEASNTEPPPSANLPAAVVAFAETGRDKTTALLQAARPYASATDASTGFYYLGSARGTEAFARFCSSLELPRKGRALRFRSVLPELLGLQKRVLNVYKPPRSIDRHADFIRLNSTLKLAFELDANTRYAAALFQYLDAVQQFSVIEMAAPGPTEKSRLSREIADRRMVLAHSQRDDSIAQLFIERTQSIIASDPTPETWKNVKSVAAHVLPAYFAFLKKSARQEQNPKPVVTVTLVRWPYT